MCLLNHTRDKKLQTKNTIILAFVFTCAASYLYQNSLSVITLSYCIVCFHFSLEDFKHFFYDKSTDRKPHHCLSASFLMVNFANLDVKFLVNSFPLAL